MPLVQRQPALKQLTPAQYQQWMDAGYLVLSGFLDQDRVVDLRDTFMDAARGGPVPGLSDDHHVEPGDPLHRWPRMMHPHRHLDLPVGAVARRAFFDPRLGEVLGDLLGEEALAAQSMFYFKPPGARGQDFHQDNFYLRVAPGTCVAAWFAIDRADSDNGGLAVVPGSHRLPVACPERSDASRSFIDHRVNIPPGLHAKHLILDPGDVLFFNGSVIHGSLPNTTADRWRRSLICHYLPRSSAEINTWYHPVHRFDGTPWTIAAASGGGPCGSVTVGPH